MFNQNANEIVPSPKAYIAYKPYTTLHTLHPQKAASTANDEEKPPRGPTPPRGFFYFPPTHQDSQPTFQATRASQRFVYNPPLRFLYHEKKEWAPRFLAVAVTFIPFRTRNHDALLTDCHSPRATKKRIGRLACNGLLLHSFPSESKISPRFSPTATLNPLWPTLERPVRDSLLRPSQPWRGPSVVLRPIASDPGETLPQPSCAPCSASEQPLDDLALLSPKLLNSLASTPHRPLNPLRHPLHHAELLARDQNS